jgi:carboxypeptidase Taq
VTLHQHIDDLLRRLRENGDLESAAAVLGWDQATYMPPGGADARGRQLATLDKLAHEKLTHPAVGKLLDALADRERALSADSFEASLIRVARRDYDRAMRLPAEFVSERAEHLAKSYDAWTRARPANDFAAVRPHLEKTLDLSRRYASFFPPSEHLADPLIDHADPGMTAAKTRAIFAELREKLVPIVQAITAQPPADDSCLHRVFPEADQLAFGRRIVEKFGYDFQRGRQDKTHHPFMTRFGRGDVRITTRTRENNLSEALFSTMHEAGHALYEQNIGPELDGTLLGQGTSAGVHESQSRLWENVVGRGRPFWSWAYPNLQKAFSAQLGNVSIDTFYRAINKVNRSLIRTDADEVTYNLHVIMRFDFEVDLLEGNLQVADLPEAWRERTRADLGIASNTDSDGVLQDVHWFGGLIGGAFQGYTLGNVMSAQFYQAAVSAHPEIPAELARGRFATLLSWLTQDVYQYGRMLDPSSLVARATGQPLSTEPYIAYLRAKYGELYELPR